MIYTDPDQEIFQLKEDFESLRKSVLERLNWLEDNLPKEFKAKAREMRMQQEIEDFRNGR